MVKAYALYPVLIGTVLQLWVMRFSVRCLTVAHFLFQGVLMKKFLTLFLAITIMLLSFSACNNVVDVITSLKLEDSKYCENTTIKSSLSTYLITPSGFDLEELNNRKYKMKITVTYDVYYTKDWDVLWDIGYLGAPEFEVCILNDDLIGNMDKNITAPSNLKTKTITYTTDIVNLIGSKVYLTFSSDNIQNKIHLKTVFVKQMFG